MASAMSFDAQARSMVIFGGSGFDDETSQLLLFEVDKYNSQKGCKKLK